MLLPTFLHGTKRDVKKACRRAATRVAKGASLMELPDDWIDVVSMTGDIVVSDMSVVDPLEANFHRYLFIEAIYMAFDENHLDPRWNRVFDEIVSLPWAIYGCVGTDHYFLFTPEGRAARFLHAVRSQWDMLNAPGRRFRVLEPVSFWEAAFSLGYCVGKVAGDRDRDELSNEVIRERADPAYHNGAMPPVIERYGA